MSESRFVKTKWMVILLAIAALAVASPGGAFGQEMAGAASSAQPSIYNLSREVTIVGKVVSFGAYPTVSTLGPHAKLQTASGLIDVHLEDARLLAANHLTIESGDTLRIVGEEVRLAGKQFSARIVQKGTQAVLVRSAGGFPLSPVTQRNFEKSQTQGGMR